MTMRTLGTALLSFATVVLICGATRAEDKQESTPAATSASKKLPAFDEFHILIERNIFDASRKPWAGASAAADASAPPPQTWRLMGTWLENDHAVALFEGMPSATHATLERGAEVAGGYHVQEIGTNGIVLNKDQEASELRVGAGLAKTETGAWSVVDTVAPPPDAAAEPSQLTPAQPATTQAAAPATLGQNPPPNGTPPAGPVKRLLKQLRKGLGS